MKKQNQKNQSGHGSHGIDTVRLEPGIWLVQNKKWGRGQQVICKLSELDRIHIPTLAALNSRRDETIKVIQQQLESRCSLNELFDNIAKVLSKGDVSPDDEQTQKFTDNL